MLRKRFTRFRRHYPKIGLSTKLGTRGRLFWIGAHNYRTATIVSVCKGNFYAVIKYRHTANTCKFLQLDDAQLQTAGLSQPKILYCRELAQAIACGQLDLDLAPIDDALLRSRSV